MLGQLSVIFLYPALIFLAIPAALIILWLTRTSFVKDDPRFDDAKAIKRRSKLRWTVFMLRTIIVLLLVASLATPLRRTSELRPGDIHLTVLVDQSNSMQAMDTSFTDKLVSDLRAQMPVTVRTIASDNDSALGDAILAAAKPGENILLISDGYETSGTSLADSLAFAAKNNVTVNAVQLQPKDFDAAVTIQGPSKAIADTNTSVFVQVTETKDQNVQLQVLVDGTAVYNQSTKGTVEIKQQFAKGQHQIVAKILGSDANSENNQYSFLLSIVEKPKVLLVTQKQTSLLPLFQQLYSVTAQPTLPPAKDLDQYYAVFLVDMPAASLDSQELTQYLLNGNGLFVAGGPASYDYGNYKSSILESLLPVTVGKGKDKQGLTNIIVAIDLTGSVSGYYQLVAGKMEYFQSTDPALVKSLANSVLSDLDANQNVGVIVVGASSDNASQNVINHQPIFWDYVGGQALGGVSALGPKRQALMDAVSKVNGGAQTPSEYWIAAPLTALQNTAGSKNIIVITDGQTCTDNCLAANGGSDQQATLNLAATAQAQGGRVYTVGIGQDVNEPFLISLANTGGGIYFPASEKNRLRILFGDPTQTTGQEAFNLVLLNPYHFITQGVTLQGSVYGFNEVIPKPGSSLLVTTGNGQPVLTVWSYGIGRVASLTGYNGNDYGELVAKGNSLILSRTGNWVIGDPERKSAYTIDVPQMYVGTPATITVKSDKIPQNGALSFSGAGNGVYEAAYTPTTTGFGLVGGVAYAANYPLEYSRVGLNPQLESLVGLTNGKLFAPDDASGIVDHSTTVRQLQESTLKPLRWPFLLAAAILFFIEIFIRRLYEVLKKR